nr:hypothetical protein [Tanacetum cinerariifolium]
MMVVKEIENGLLEEVKNGDLSKALMMKDKMMKMMEVVMKLSGQDWTRKRRFEKERKSWKEMIDHHLHQWCHPTNEMRMDALKCKGLRRATIQSSSLPGDKLLLLFVKIGVLQIGTRAKVIENKVVDRVMSSPNHPTSDIEDAFSSNSPNYTPASPDYFPVSLGNTSYDSLKNSPGLVPVASPTLSIFHDNPYMKVMHAYDAIIPPQVLIPPQLLCLYL